MINQEQLVLLLSDLESDRIERTLATNHTDKFCIAVCAFANDLPNHQKPSYLLIGVNDDGSLSGLKVTDELLKNSGVFIHWVYPFYQAKAMALNAPYFALGICGIDEIAKALPLIANCAGESFWLLFAGKSNSHCPAEGSKAGVRMPKSPLKINRIQINCFK
nr:ATP-binding protein [uncultured Pedobacter sp.]